MNHTPDLDPPLAADIASAVDLALAKSRLRPRMRALRRKLAQSAPQAAHEAARLAPADAWAAFGTIAGYAARGSEIDPAPLLARLAVAGARIVLPAATALDAPLVFRDAVGAADLIRDAAGVLAPPPGAATGVPRLVITPLLAFDRAGGRLGQGGGYYDRTLAALRATGPVTAVGLAFAGQALAHIPAGPLDQRLDAILTETGYMRI